MVRYLVKTTGSDAILEEVVAGRSIRERIISAFDAVPSDPDTGLVFCSEEDRAVSFGFYDTIIQTGNLLFASLLRRTAALDLAALVQIDVDRYKEAAKLIGEHILPVFGADQSGLLRSATGIGRQEDVRGSAFAVASGGIEGSSADSVGSALVEALTRISYHGQFRHVPVGAEHGPDSARERTIGPVPLNRYQNGAYWGTPAGWICCAIARVDPPAAASLAHEMIESYRADDFRRGAEFGSPWECINADQNPVYLTSVACPLPWLRELVV